VSRAFCLGAGCCAHLPSLNMHVNRGSWDPRCSVIPSLQAAASLRVGIRKSNVLQDVSGKEVLHSRSEGCDAFLQWSESLNDLSDLSKVLLKMHLLLVNRCCAVKHKAIAQPRHKGVFYRFIDPSSSVARLLGSRVWRFSLEIQDSTTESREGEMC